MANLSIIGNVTREVFVGDAVSGYGDLFVSLFTLVGVIFLFFMVMVFMDLFMSFWDWLKDLLAKRKGS